VINKSGYASEEVRERVEAAIAELGYVPNTLARSLRSKRTDTLALVLTDITNPFFTQVARGVEDAASDAGFTVIYCNTDESEDEEAKYLGVLVQKQVDGFLLVPACSTSRSVGFVNEQRAPVVVLDRRLAGAKADMVRCDSVDGAYRLVRLLQESGHRRIAILTGPEEVSTAEDRVAGYVKAMQEAGVVDQSLVYHGRFTQKSGYEMAAQAIAADPPPTALLAANNFIAIGALKALRQAGLRVPQELSIAAFDDLPEEMVVEPFLSVASQPAYEMGRRATELLLGRLSGEVSGDRQEIVLPIEIIVRDSIRPISG
jgi:LacI family transcriptional regulator